MSSPKKRRKIHFCSSEHTEGSIYFITACVDLNVNNLHGHIIFNAWSQVDLNIFEEIGDMTLLEEVFH